MDSDQSSEKELARRALSEAIAESLFVGLPLIVYAIVNFAGDGTTRDLIAIPEVSFAASILLGQTVMKLVQTAAESKPQRLRKESFILLVTVVIVCGLVPCLIVLGLILSSPQPQFALIILQLFFLGAGLASFLTTSQLAFLATSQLHGEDGLRERDPPKTG